MKVLPFKIPKPSEGALVYKVDRDRVFYDQLHQHGEIQISYIAKGAGTLIVGGSINEYRAGDIFVIGGYVPHVFKSEVNASDESLMHTLFFDANSFGRDFFKISDLQATKDFFRKSDFGIRVLTEKELIIRKFKKLESCNKLEQIATLLMVISLITKARTTPLASFVYKKTFSEDEGRRMNDVFKYAMENFHNPVSLDDIAGIANMSRNAFCRYFKKRTDKTFFQFLIEIRIENACKQILDHPEASISSVAYQCGFNNIANFNRKFKLLKRCSPSEFRARFS